MSETPFVIIVGAPRSGTTLLSLILEQDFGVAVPTETHFIPMFGRWLWLWGDLSKAANRARLLGAIYDFLAVFTPRSLQGRDMSKAEQFSLLATKDQRQRIVDESDSYTGLVHALFAAYARLRSTPAYGDKSAYYSPMAPEQSVRHLPGAKVLHIMRDGRDVCLSWRGIWCGPRSTSRAADLWSGHIAANRDFGKRHPDQYLEIRYEDLLDNPQQTLNQIARFLGRERAGAETAFHEHQFAQVLSQGGIHDRISGPLNPKNKDKWRQIMRPKDVQEFEKVAAGALRGAGYELSSEAEPKPLADNIPKLGGSTWATSLMRRCKPALPPILFGLHLTGTRLAKLTGRE